MSDLRYALRNMRQGAGFAIVAIPPRRWVSATNTARLWVNYLLPTLRTGSCDNKRLRYATRRPHSCCFVAVLQEPGG